MNRGARILLLLCCGLAVFIATTFGQPKVTGRISGGFQAPTSTDERGRRHVLKGESAEPRGNDLYELTQPRVTSFNADDTPEMFIEAPRCFYEMRANTAYSDSTLSVRTADGRFSIQGVGWGWNPDSMQLTISNQVVAFVQKAALATNLVAGSGTNAPVKITSKGFEQVGEKAAFIGNVVVEDGPDRLTCDRLEITFVKPDGLQTIDAIGSVVLVQKQATVRSGRAIYSLKNDEVRITEAPRWVSEQREGSAKLLVLNRAENALIAEGEVYMKFPITNVVETSSGRSVATNRFLEVFSEMFRFEDATSNRLASAFYRGGVRVVHPEAAISSRELTVGFNATNRIQRIVAVDEVKVESGGNQAFGKQAEYDLQAEKISLIGDPNWKLEESTGSSDVLVFYPRTKEVLALQNVHMTIPGQSVGTLFSVNVKTNTPVRTQPVGTNTTPMTIRADTFSRGTNVAVFNGNVEISDDRGKMSCPMITIVSAGTNDVQRVIAEGGVRIEQPDMVATGARAEYNVETGLVHLTGAPLLVSEGRTLRADAFIIDRNKNTFSVSPGKFRIEVPMTESQKLKAGRLKL
ncbi:MAG TPA: LptA/OstA family protein [Verrucomicrobiae bacterium]